MEELDELDFLSSTALRLAEIPPEADLFQFVAEQVGALAQMSVVVTLGFDASTGSLVVRALVGPKDMVKKVLDVLGSAGRLVNGGVIGVSFVVDEAKRRVIAEGKLLHIEGGLGQVTEADWPTKLAHELETQLGIRAMYAQPFAREGDFIGAAVILCQRESLEHARVIEAFTRLAAVALQRRRAETRLRESEHAFRMLAENSQDVVYRLRVLPTKAFEYVSPASTRVLGLTPQELYANADLGAGCLYDRRWTEPEKLDEASNGPVVAHCRRKDGTPIWTEQNVTPIRGPDGSVVALEGSTRDITKRKEAEDAVVEADRRKTEFLAVLSHELRNPLGPIQNALFILTRADPAGEQAVRARAIIDRQIGHMTRLVDDLLDVTRITRGKIRLQRERIDLDTLVRSTVDDHRAMFVSRDIIAEVQSSRGRASIHGDKTRIAQVVGNLLTNALKFTAPGGRVSVSVSADDARGDAVIRVRDTGAGVAPEDLPHLFEPFMQADTTLDRSKGGLGLGLMLVKGLVEMHGGSVTAESPGPGKGTEFTIRLPLAEAVTAGREGYRPKPSPTSRRVLVIDDNVDAANSLKEALELDQHEVEVAYDGRAGLAKAHEFRPDVVICDIGLPEMDGYAVARAMRAAPDLRTVPLVALTGYASAEDVARSYEAGFDRHIAKPPTIDALENAVAELAGGAGG